MTDQSREPFCGAHLGQVGKARLLAAKNWRTHSSSTNDVRVKRVRLKCARCSAGVNRHHPGAGMSAFGGFRTSLRAASDPKRTSPEMKNPAEAGCHPTRQCSDQISDYFREERVREDSESSLSRYDSSSKLHLQHSARKREAGPKAIPVGEELRRRCSQQM